MSAIIDRLKQLRSEFSAGEDAGTLTDERHDALLDEMDGLWAQMSREAKDEYNAWNLARTEARLAAEGPRLTDEQRASARAKLRAAVEAKRRRSP